jgi:hypothetical protein
VNNTEIEALAQAIWDTLNLGSKYTFLETWGPPYKDSEVMRALVGVIKDAVGIERES